MVCIYIIYIYTSNHKLYLLQPSNGQSWRRFVGFATNVNSYGGYHLSFESLSHAITILGVGYQYYRNLDKIERSFPTLHKTAAKYASRTAPNESTAHLGLSENGVYPQL